MPAPQTEWTEVEAGHYRRGDGVSIRKVNAPAFRRMTGRRCYLTGVWWVAFDHAGQPVGNSPMFIGGRTFAEAQSDLARHERKTAA